MSLHEPVDQILEVIGEVRPRLRGWLHLTAVPVALAAGALLIALSPSGAPRTGAIIFVTCGLLLFTASAALHRGRWTLRAGHVVTRLDHACILLLIAGTCTPFGLLLLGGRDRAILLTVAWTGAALGIAFQLLWTQAPRWVTTSLYLTLGWVPIFFASDMARQTTPAVIVLIAFGGLLYSIGAIVHGLRRPNPIPDWFGFHEVFHTLTVFAFAAHYAAVSMTTYALR